ncbi:MAG: YfcE family phosphodiesterase [Bacteroidetes bacterium]|nr:MAG: YfcE family phosphodiesterase [Bacteroidota bacterium]
MLKIGLLSDTHAVLDPRILDFLKGSDEIWHAGDWGDISLYDELAKIAFVRGVYGNVDGPINTSLLPENQIFTVEKVKVVMTHIGGYPGRYVPRLRQILLKEKPQLYVCGHSHILKVVYDKKYQLLHINPGAAGHSGFHKVITAVRFQINGERIENLEVFEIPRKSRGY